MIEYIVNTPKGSKIYKSDEIIESTNRNLFHIQLLCKKFLFTYEGYLEAVKQIIQLKYQIPIVLSNQLVLFPIKRVRDFDNIWINDYAIYDVINFDSGLKIIFKSKRILSIDFTYKEYLNTKIKIEKIKKHIIKTLSCHSL